MFAVNPVRGAEVHGNTVLNNAILIEDSIEDVQGPAAVDHEIFGNNFKPVDDRFTREDVVVVRGAQTNSDPVVRECIEAISGH